MKIRRVVVGTGADGKARVFEDGVTPRHFEFASGAGNAGALLWATGATDAVSRSDIIHDATKEVGFVPGTGESRIMITTFPPDSAMMRPDFDAAAFGEEFARLLPGLAEKFEPDNPGMHRTDSIDYDVVLEGEITLELDDGKEVLMRKHDVCVQHGNRHAWRNKGNKPAVMLFVLLGAKRSS
jgi:mannose-6-phosphate isomerase-like protein (cupin superfamily)